MNSIGTETSNRCASRGRSGRPGACSGYPKKIKPAAGNAPPISPSVPATAATIGRHGRTRVRRDVGIRLSSVARVLLSGDAAASRDALLLRGTLAFRRDQLLVPP